MAMWLVGCEGESKPAPPDGGPTCASSRSPCTGTVCCESSDECILNGGNEPFCIAVTCSATGVACSLPEECCEHLTCVAEACSCGMQSSPCVTAEDCCEGLVCFPNAGCQFPE